MADTQQSPTPVERILAELDALNREVEASLTTPEPVTDSRGRVWEWWKGNLYRHGNSAVPLEMLRML